MIYNVLLSYLKCYLSPSGHADKKTVKGEVDAIARIKNWYLQNYLYYFGKATIPGVNFSRADARHIRENLDRITCKNEDVYMSILFYSIVAGVVMLIVGWMIGHARGKKACLQHIASIATRMK